MEIIIASIKFSIEDTILDNAVKEVLRPFTCTSASSFSTEYHIKPFSEDPFRFAEKTEKRLLNYFHEDENELYIGNKNAVCRLDKKCGIFELQYISSPVEPRLRFLSILKFLLSELLLTSGGVLLHASGVCCNNAAYLFTGPSGAGKTTIVRSLKHAVPINDELMIIIPENNKIIGYSSPFGTKEHNINKPFDIPVKSIYNLRKSTRTHTVDMNKREKTMALAPGIFHFPTSDNKATQLLDAVNHILLHVNCKTLYLNKNDSLSTLTNVITDNAT